MKLTKLSHMIYNAFIHDTVRLYKVLPKNFHVEFWFLLAVQIIFALLETSTILVISFFALSLGSPESAQNYTVIKFLFYILPPIKDSCSNPRCFVAFACSLVVFFVFLKNIVAYISMSLNTKFAENVSCYIGSETLRRYLNNDYFWHISPKSADIIQKMNYRSNLAHLLVMLLQLYGNVICVIILFGSLLIAEPKLTGIVVLVFSIVGTSTYIGLKKNIDKAGHKVRVCGDKENASMIGITHGIREVLIYNKQKAFFDNMTDSMKEGRKPRSFLTFSGQLPSWLLEVAGFGTICAVVFYLLKTNVPMQDIIKASSMLMLTAWRVLPAVNKVLSFAVSIRGLRPISLPCLDLLETFIKENPKEKPEPDPNFTFKKEIQLKDVSFKYPTSEFESLKNLNFTIKKGQSIGLIGPSGAGKSTLALILSGLLKPSSGSFKVDEKTVEGSYLSAYLKQIGYVPQNPLMLDGTISDNIAFSKWGEQYDHKDVLKACEMAAVNFIHNNPEGIHFRIKANGLGLSGGQIQRLAIARALFNQPKTIIFDEATSALDGLSENTIKETILKLKGEVTLIIVAHRLTTVEDCDLIVWLDKGQIVEIGTPSTIIPKYNKSLQMNNYGN